MKAPGYGEDQPRYDDDRLPVVLVLLDGLGDRALPDLGGRTPSEAAHTPNLDAFARRGASGWHLPFGWGAAPSSPDRSAGDQELRVDPRRHEEPWILQHGEQDRPKGAHPSSNRPHRRKRESGHFACIT